MINDMIESNEDREPVEVLADDFIERCRLRGERPYDQRVCAADIRSSPSEIRELFPTIAAIEQAKSASPGQSNGGGPFRGGLKPRTG